MVVGPEDLVLLVGRALPGLARAPRVDQDVLAVPHEESFLFVIVNYVLLVCMLICVVMYVTIYESVYLIAPHEEVAVVARPVHDAGEVHQLADERQGEPRVLAQGPQ